MMQKNKNRYQVKLGRGLTTCKTLAMCMVLLCSGCKSAEPKEETEQAQSFSSQEYLQEFQKKEQYDVFAETWTPKGELQNAKIYWSAIDYKEKMFPEQEGEPSLFFFQSADGKDFYYWASYYFFEEDDNTKVKGVKYVLNHLDTNTLEATATIVQQDGDERGLFQDAFPASFDSSGGERCIFLQGFDEEGELNHFYATMISENGEPQNAVDLVEGIREADILPQKNFMMDAFYYDHRGFYYTINDRRTEICVFDSQGHLAERINSMGDEACFFDIFCKSRNGEYVFAATPKKGASGKKQRTVFGYEEQGVKVLFTEEAEMIDHAMVNAYGEMYYLLQGNMLVKRDLKTGSCEKCYIGVLQNFANMEALLQNDKGELVCIQRSRYDYTATVYSPAGVEREVTLNLYSYYYSGYNLETAITEFQRKHPGVKIQVTESEFGTRDTDFAKLVGQLVQGEGPDIFVMPREQMQVMAQKGVLADVSEVLPKEVKEQILPAALQYGTVDGKLYGLAYSGYPDCLAALDEVWSKDTWTIEDICRMMEEKAKTTEPYEALCNDFDLEAGMTGIDMLSIFLKNPDASPFVALEQKTCRFDSPEFIELLEFCKKYHKPDNGENFHLAITDSSYTNMYKDVREGRLLCHRLHDVGSVNLISFSRSMAGLGEAHTVGYPSIKGNGKYFICDDLLAVNKNAENFDVISEFLNYFYSMEMQIMVSTVRMDILDKCVVEKVDWSSDAYLHLPGDNSWTSIAKKKGGGTYLPEYLTLLQECTIIPDEAEKIRQMIYDETEPFFENERDAQTTARILQSRVSLYLAE